MNYQVGDIVNGARIGKAGSHRYILVQCPQCHKVRWYRTDFAEKRGMEALCNHCVHSRRGGANPRWKGGRIKLAKGYIRIRLQPGDFFYPMTDKCGNVLEHRLVVAKALGRCLLPWEIVHHRGAKYPSGSNENRGDNRYPENLELLSDKRWHLIDSVTRVFIQKQSQRITVLEAELTLLRSQLEKADGMIMEMEQLKRKKQGGKVNA